MTNVSTLIDALTTTSLATVNWTSSVGTNATITPTVNGVVLANAIGTTLGNDAIILSASSAWTFDQVSFQLTNVTSPSNAGFVVNVMNSGSVYVGFTLDHATLSFLVNAVGQGSVTFNAIAHRWLMISTTGANVIWSASPDGVNWNTLFTYSTSNPLSGLNCYVRISTYVDATLTAASSYTVSDVNLLPSAPQVNNWLAGYDITPASGTTPGDLDVYAGQAFNFLATPPYLRAVQATVQSLAASTWDTIAFDTVLDQQGCQFTTGASCKFTATYSGWYSISLTANTDPTVGCQTQLGVQFSILGNTVGPVILEINTCDADPWMLTSCVEYYLNPGDTVTPLFYHNAASAFNSQVSASPYWDCSSIEIVWISE